VARLGRQPPYRLEQVQPRSVGARGCIGAVLRLPQGSREVAQQCLGGVQVGQEMDTRLAGSKLGQQCRLTRASAPRQHDELGLSRLVTVGQPPEFLLAIDKHGPSPQLMITSIINLTVKLSRVRARGALGRVGRDL